MADKNVNETSANTAKTTGANTPASSSTAVEPEQALSLIHISEPTRPY